jgi:hypothetical protein
METDQSSRSLFPIPQLAIYLQLRSRVYITFSFLIGVMLIICLITLSRLSSPPSNPFADYTNLIHDAESTTQFWSSYETLLRAAFQLACTTSLIEKYCFYRTESGPFEFVKFVELNSEGMEGVYFAVRDNALTVGDVAMLWGRPTIRRHDHSLTLYWPAQHMSSVVRSDSGQFNYRLPVPYLLLRGDAKM